MFGGITETDYRFAPNASRRPSQSFTTNSREPWHVGKSAHELDASSCMLGVQRVRIFDEYIRVEQLVRIFVGVGCGRFGTAEMNRMLVAGNDGVNRRVLPRAQTLETKLILVIGKSSGNVPGEELRRNLTDDGPSLVQKNAGADQVTGCVLFRVARTRRSYQSAFQVAEWETTTVPKSKKALHPLKGSIHIGAAAHVPAQWRRGFSCDSCHRH
jgi:hypothetical protein